MILTNPNILSSMVGRVRRFSRIRLARTRVRFTRKALSVNFCGNGIGFFAQLNLLLRLVEYKKRHNIRLNLRFSSGHYLDEKNGDNWLSQYFVAQPGSGFSLTTKHPIYIHDFPELGIQYDKDPTLEEANLLINANICIRPEISSTVDEFCRNNEIDETSLGVHYRGTDKFSEAAPVKIDWVLRIINDYIKINDNIKTVFIASDEQQFIDSAFSEVIGARVVALDDHVRSKDGRPVHLDVESADKYRLGLDALVNCLVMSRCGTLIRSTSFLSAWASIFNPAINVILLNRPFDATTWYPEREIMKTAVILDSNV